MKKMFETTTLEEWFNSSTDHMWMYYGPYMASWCTVDTCATPQSFVRDLSHHILPNNSSLRISKTALLCDTASLHGTSISHLPHGEDVGYRFVPVPGHLQRASAKHLYLYNQRIAPLALNNPTWFYNKNDENGPRWRCWRKDNTHINKTNQMATWNRSPIVPNKNKSSNLCNFLPYVFFFEKYVVRVQTRSNCQIRWDMWFNIIYPWSTNVAMEYPHFQKNNIFNPGLFSIAMLVCQSGANHLNRHLLVHWFFQLY